LIVCDKTNPNKALWAYSTTVFYFHKRGSSVQKYGLRYFIFTSSSLRSFLLSLRLVSLHIHTWVYNNCIRTVSLIRIPTSIKHRDLYLMFDEPLMCTLYRIPSFIIHRVLFLISYVHYLSLSRWSGLYKSLYVRKLM